MLRAAQTRYAAQRAVSVSTVQELERLWKQLDPGALDVSFQAIAGPLLQRLVAGQYVSAALAQQYISNALAEQGFTAAPVATVVPRAFAGTASDGRPLASLLYEPVIAVKSGYAQGLDGPTSLARGLTSLVRIGATQIADAGRGAESVSIASRPQVQGYVRMLTPPSCGRCAVLAGRFYRWSAGFERHPHCDCIHVPVSENVSGDLRTDPRAAILSGDVTGLSKADTRAIEDGADVSQVINAHRGMYTADVYGTRVKATLEAAAATGSPRLRPESIYRLAGDDRAEAIRLLQRFGYLSN